MGRGRGNSKKRRARREAMLLKRGGIPGRPGGLRREAVPPDVWEGVLNNSSNPNSPEHVMLESLDMED